MFPTRIARHVAAPMLLIAAGVSHAASAPTATTLAASAISATSAQLNASVAPNGASTVTAFQLGTTTSYGTIVYGTPQTVSSTASATAVRATATGLKCGTTYHYQIGTRNSAGDRLGADVAFTTSACSTPPPTTTAPTATTGSASGITTTGATVGGTATAGSAAATVMFDYGTTTSYGGTVSASPASLAANAGSTAESAALSGLTCGTTYHFRIRASSSAGTAQGADRTFATATCPVSSTPPTATTGSASSITTTSATLGGTATAGSSTATVNFDYGTTTSYGASVSASPASLAANAGSTAESAAISGLTCGTTYHFRVRAASSAGSAQGADRTFATATCPVNTTPPTATTGSAGAITATSATLNATATAGSATAQVSFDYGSTTAYGATIAATPSTLAANAGSTAASAAISGLACGTTYHFRAKASSSAGSALGSDRSFTTTACSNPPPTTLDCSQANVRCVAPSGANAEYTTIQAAVNAAQAGDTVLVFDGSYVGFVVSRSGTATAPITVKANGTGAVIDRASSAGEGIRVNNSNYVVIEGFTIKNIRTFGLAARGATPTAPMRGLVFRDNTVLNCGAGELDANIYASEVADSLIEGNSATGSTGHGLYLANAGSKNTTVRGNHLYANTTSGIHVNGDESVGGDGLVTGALIEENIIHDNGGNGLNLDGVQSSTFRNNVIYNNGHHAIRAFQIDGAAGPRNLVIVNNTIVVKSSPSNTGIKLSEDGGGHTIFNNVIDNQGSGGSIIASNASLKADRNTYVNASFSLNGGSSMLTLAQWKAQAGAYDANSTSTTESVLFVAAASGDFRLKSGSPAANAGVASFNGVQAPTSDITGAARPQGGAIDQGAYESF